MSPTRTDSDKFASITKSLKFITWPPFFQPLDKKTPNSAGTSTSYLTKTFSTSPSNSKSTKYSAPAQWQYSAHNSKIKHSSTLLHLANNHVRSDKVRRRDVGRLLLQKVWVGCQKCQISRNYQLEGRARRRYNRLCSGNLLRLYLERKVHLLRKRINSPANDVH